LTAGIGHSGSGDAEPASVLGPYPLRSLREKATARSGWARYQRRPCPRRSSSVEPASASGALAAAFHQSKADLDWLNARHRSLLRRCFPPVWPAAGEGEDLVGPQECGGQDRRVAQRVDLDGEAPRLTQWSTARAPAQRRAAVAREGATGGGQRTAVMKEASNEDDMGTGDGGRAAVMEGASTPGPREDAPVSGGDGAAWMLSGSTVGSCRRLLLGSTVGFCWDRPQAAR
jgi:hypothetical protein